VSLFEQVALALQALRHTLAALRSPRLWVPWLVLGACQLAVVLAIWHFAHPVLSWFMAPLLRALAGADALHYPNALEMMPRLYDRADVVLGALLGSVMIGASAPLFAEHFRGGVPRVGPALRAALRRAPALVLCQLPFNLLVTGLVFGVGGLLEARGGGGVVSRAAEFAVASLALVVQAAFFYVTARLVLDPRGVGGALAGVPSDWRRGFAPALTVGALTVLLLLPLHWVAGREDLVVSRGRPELVGWLTVVELLAGLLNWFLLTGSATLIYLSVLQGRREER
jgi:hypothetical protein